MKRRPIIIVYALYLSAIWNVHNAFGWFDETHLAVAKAAGYHKWYNVVGPDIAKIKAGDVEKYNHFFKALRVRVWVILYLLEHRCKNFQSQIFLIS